MPRAIIIIIIMGVRPFCFPGNIRDVHFFYTRCCIMCRALVSADHVHQIAWVCLSELHRSPAQACSEDSGVYQPQAAVHPSPSGSSAAEKNRANPAPKKPRRSDIFVPLGTVEMRNITYARKTERYTVGAPQLKACGTMGQSRTEGASIIPAL